MVLTRYDGKKGEKGGKIIFGVSPFRVFPFEIAGMLTRVVYNP